MEDVCYTKDLMIKVNLLHPVYIQVTSRKFWEVFSKSQAGSLRATNSE